MADYYYYHGSPIELSELKERNPGEGIYLTSEPLAGLWGAVRQLKKDQNGWDKKWAYDFLENDKDVNPTNLIARHNMADVPDIEGDYDTYVHRIKLTKALKKYLEKRKNEAIFRGETLPVDSVKKIRVHYKSKYDPDVDKDYGSLVKASSKKLFTEINDLMDGYEWEAIDPVSGEKIYSPGKGFFTTSNPVSYSYQGGGEKPFKGNCIEQALFVKERYPDAKLLFSRDAKPGVNRIHVTPLLQDDNGYYHHVKLHPVKDKKGRPQYLSGGRFRNLKNFLKGTAHKWGDRDIDYYVLDDIPRTGDARTLQRFADRNATPIRVRNGKVLGKNKFEKNFHNIVDRYKKLYDIDLSDVGYLEDTVPKYNNGEYSDQFTSEETGGSWMRYNGKRLININPNPKDVIKHWNLDVTPTQFVNHIIAHELGHDVEHIRKYKEFRKRMIEEAKKQNFTTPYLDDVAKNRKHKLNSETFAEYMAHMINQKNASAPEDLVKELAPLRYEHPELTQTIKQILQDGHTSCWGVSRLAMNRLRKAGLDPESVFVYEDEVPMLPTHQFTTYKDGDKFRVHDNFGQDSGIGPAFDTREEAIDDRVARWRKHENHYNPVHVYTGTRLPRPGIDSPEYMYRIMKLLKYMKTYPKMEKESSIQTLAEHARIVSTVRRNFLTDF